MFLRNRSLLFHMIILFSTPLAHAEVTDKCPLFVSQMLEAKGFVLLSGGEALFRLFIFTGIYLSIWSFVYLIWWKFRWAWLKFIPLISAILVLFSIVSDLFDREHPCHLFSMLQNLSFPLNVIEGCFYLILILCPLSLFLLLKKKTVLK